MEKDSPSGCVLEVHSGKAWRANGGLAAAASPRVTYLSTPPASHLHTLSVLRGA